MRWIRIVRVAAAGVTIAVTLGLVVADAAIGRDLLTPERLKLLFGFIGMLLGVDVMIQKVSDFRVDISFGKRSSGSGRDLEQERLREYEDDTDGRS